MGNESELLRMLEPAVRPGGLPGPGRPGRVPIESRDFDSLLQEAQQMNAQQEGIADEQEGSAEGVQESVKETHGGLIGRLGQVGLIENESLRSLIEGHSDKQEADPHSMDS